MRKVPWLLLLGVPLQVFAQGLGVPPRWIIDTPTAGTLPRVGFDFSVRTYGDGGLLGSVNVGVSERFMFGVSYGGTNLLGNGVVGWNETPGVNLRYQLIEESFGLPAVTLGFDSQGFGAFNDSLNRYANKSPGFFLVTSKGYDLFERLDFHGGVNYSLETADGDRDVNLFGGATLALNSDFEVLCEYDFALNDNDNNSITSGRGFLNVGARLNIRSVVYVEFFLKDILENRKEIVNANREMKITYFQFIH